MLCNTFAPATCVTDVAHSLAYQVWYNFHSVQKLHWNVVQLPVELSQFLDARNETTTACMYREMMEIPLWVLVL